jgi:hypothetical protein
MDTDILSAKEGVVKNKKPDFGVNAGSINAGISEIGGDYEYAQWSLGAIQGEARAGLSTGYQGYNAEASLITASGGIKIPVPFTDIKIVVDGNLNLFAIGAHSEIDIENKKFSTGASAIVGGGITISIEEGN